jgi:hypothetical protein
MKTISISMVSLLAMGGLAFAQTAKGSGATGATAGAGVTVKAGAGAGSGSAAAGAKATGGATTGQTLKGGAPATPVAPPAPMEMPKPPAEIAAAAKMMSKTLSCTGTGLGPDMKTEAKMKTTMSAKSDFGGWWIRQTIKGTVGEGKTKMKMQMEGLMSYDAKLAKWRFLGVSNDGGSMTGMADMKDGKYELVGEMTSPMGTATFKDHGDMTDKKAIHFWGEMSMDKGKTWTKVYDQTCK